MAELKNELIFLNELILKKLINTDYESTNKNIQFSMRKPQNKDVLNLLSTASKNMTGNNGYPDFIFEDLENNLIIVVENKENITNHFSNEYKNKNDSDIKKFAVDGALWYAEKLKEKFNVIALGVSGTSKSELKIDTFSWAKESDRFSNINKNEILSFDEYLFYFEKNKKIRTNSQVVNRLSEIAIDLNEGMKSYIGIEESKRYYLVASILIALENYDFKINYSSISSSGELLKKIFETSANKFKEMKYYPQLIEKLRFIENIADKSEKFKYPHGYIREMISILDSEVFVFYKESNIDVLSYFFTLFLQYSTSGGSEMGIVLTPPHITNLFARLAKINLNSRIIDPCLGTGGFLSASWKYIFNSNYTKDEKERFRHNNLMGIEFSPDIYPAAILNMLINKDGKSNFLLGDSFEYFKTGELQNFRANVGFINPPYSDRVKSEIEFVELMLNSLEPDSIGIAIIPVNAVSTRTKKHGQKIIVSAKERILKNNNLLASIQMPSNLFYPKATETVILIFKTGISNKNKKTWFSKFDDGYELIKQSKTRTSTTISEERTEQLIVDYERKSLNNGEFLQEINSQMQWVYTVLRDNDYRLEIEDLNNKAKEYAIYKILNKNE